MLWKYAGDYRAEKLPDARGKLKTISVYTGKYYRFRAPADRVRRMKVLYPAAWGVGALAWLCALWLFPVGQRLGWGFLVPMAAASLVLFYGCCGIWRLITAGERVTREHRDKLGGRLTRCGAAQLICGVLAAAGQTAITCANAFSWKNPAVLLLAAVFAGCGGGMLAMRDGISMEEIS